MRFPLAAHVQRKKRIHLRSSACFRSALLSQQFIDFLKPFSFFSPANLFHCFLWNGCRSHPWQACGASRWWLKGVFRPCGCLGCRTAGGFHIQQCPQTHIKATFSLLLWHFSLSIRYMFTPFFSSICTAAEVKLFTLLKASFWLKVCYKSILWSSFFFFFWCLLLTEKDLLSLLEIHHLFTDLWGLHPAFSAAGLLVHFPQTRLLSSHFLPRRMCSKLPRRHRSELFENPR